MSNHRHQFRLWALGTLVIMVTLGSLTGIMLRQWSHSPDAAPADSGAMGIAVGVLLLGLIALWFRNGHQLWTAAKAR